ncbi:hypothetical protein NPIL_555741 [Nephila pilipes]|uniref:Uncharacterized protein n=1 Tax=Nephila pilipes TaxID=299642 RepID=A0A8X6PPE7_NEPPI|nr:hypothetical protein NPIL_555741 [Nephila pilipes]
MKKSPFQKEKVIRNRRSAASNSQDEYHDDRSTDASVLRNTETSSSYGNRIKVHSRKLNELLAIYPNYTRSREARDTDGAEIEVLLGLLNFAGVYHGDRVNLEELGRID